jgi:probable O-glycosylation ligase (exosortase A-associated)
MRDILLITIVIVASLIALRKPVFGILAFLVFGIINPQGMVFGVGRVLPLGMLTAVGTVLGYLLWSEPKWSPRHREMVLLLALWATFVISTPLAVYPDLAYEHLILTSKILFMTYMTMLIINTEQRLHLLLKAIALSLGVLGLKSGLFVIATGGSQMVYGPDLGFLSANNSIGLALAMNVPLLVYTLKRESYKYMQWLIRAMIVLSYPAVVCTFSRGAWIGLAAATALLVLKGRRKFMMVTVLSLVVVLVIPLLPERVTTRYDDLRNYQEENSAQSRLWNWEFCKRVGMANPLHGGGFDFYSLESYARFYPEFLEHWPGKVWSCHSSWLTILGEHGIVAFLLWISLLISCFLSLKRLGAYARSHPEQEWLEPFVNTVQIAIVTYLIVATFLDAAYFDIFYELIGAIVIAKALVRREAAREQARARAEGLQAQFAYPRAS